ncbi:MAG: TRAP transporter small permease subunit [Burkholderiaceae bacterium]|nr:TRAP transporter small permease subunit [Burkholderiaceae bacterium]
MNLFDRLARRLGESLAWLFAVATVLIAYEVLRRYGFNNPTIWVHDLTIALCAICFVFGGAYAMQRNEHIRITSIVATLPQSARRWLTFAHDVLTLVFLAALSYAAIRQAATSIDIMETSGRAWNVPIPVLLKLVLALGAVLMTAQAVCHALESLRGKRVAV